MFHMVILTFSKAAQWSHFNGGMCCNGYNLFQWNKVTLRIHQYQIPFFHFFNIEFSDEFLFCNILFIMSKDDIMKINDFKSFSRNSTHVMKYLFWCL